MTGSLHSIHPMLVHFTIALLISSSVLLLVGKVFVDRGWAHNCRTVGNWNMILGALSALATVAAGMYAFNTVNHDTASHLAMIEHRNIAIPATLLWCGLAVWRFRVLRKERRSGWPFFTGVFLAFSLLVLTGFKGGDLVYKHGLGVASLPAVSGDGHDHEHAPGQEHETPTPSPAADVMPKHDAKHDDSDGHAHADAVEQPVEAEVALDAVKGHDNSDGHHDVVMEQPAPTPDAGHAHSSDSKPHAH